MLSPLAQFYKNSKTEPDLFISELIENVCVTNMAISALGNNSCEIITWGKCDLPEACFCISSKVC